jgi:hypothetical protein
VPVSAFTVADGVRSSWPSKKQRTATSPGRSGSSTPSAAKNPIALSRPPVRREGDVHVAVADRGASGTERHRQRDRGPHPLDGVAHRRDLRYQPVPLNTERADMPEMSL